MPGLLEQHPAEHRVLAIHGNLLLRALTFASRSAAWR